MIQLRPDQFDLDNDMTAAFNAGARNVLGVLPTGGGKSVIMSERILRRHLLGSVQFVGAHRVELVGQMSMHVARRGIKHRIIAPKDVVNAVIAEQRDEFNGHSFVNPSSNCSVGSVDTLNARKDELVAWAAQVDHWSMDEAHHLLRLNKWGKAVALFPNARGEGWTASPQRAGGEGLGSHADGVFDAMAIGPDMRHLINIGALTDYEIAIPESDFEIDDSDIPAGGDFTTAKMRDASRRSHIVGDVVKEYVARAYGKRFICFATDVETAGKMADQFMLVGIPVAAVSAKTPPDLRREYIRRFKAGQLWGLINVDLFGEGFDVPAVEVVIMARPTASLAVYLQQFGRALRTMFGKQYGLVIDHVSNWKRHGFPDKAHYWTLDRREKRGKKEKDPEEIDLTACRSCSRPYERFYSACPHCGAVPPLPDPASRTLEQVDGNLFLLTRERIAAMHAATVLESPAEAKHRVGAVMGDGIGTAALNRSMEKHMAQQRLKLALAQWGAIQRAKGRPDDQSYKRFYLTTGIDMVSALDATRSRQDYESLAVKVEGWCVP
jgi:superfamily II DNA or RNA helicase